MKVAIVFAACIALALGACPRIVTRSQWGARAPTGSTSLANPVQYVVIHHGASAACTTEASCIAMVKSYQNQHMDVNGWADIGYNYIVGGDGNVYEGRGWSKQGAHAPGFNNKSIGICFIGTFTSGKPTAAAIAAAKQLIKCGMDDRHVQLAHSLVGHRQDPSSSTECPGNSLYNEIKTWANYDPTP